MGGGEIGGHGAINEARGQWNSTEACENPTLGDKQRQMQSRAEEENHCVWVMQPRGGRPEAIKLKFYRKKIFTYFYTFIQFPLKSSNLSSTGNVPPFRDFAHLPTRIIF